MMYYGFYDSPLGRIVLGSDGESLMRLDFGECNGIVGELPVFCEVRRWLDDYFAGLEPRIKFPVLLDGTDFQRKVWAMLAEIPYGRTVTYGELAEGLGERRGVKMSAQAVGGAVGKNPVSIIVPCHRVVGAGGALVGYRWGLDKKAALLSLEGIKSKK